MISVDDARRALRFGGRPIDEDGSSRCPLCVAKLLVSQNGNGAHLECTNGCEGLAVEGALRVFLNAGRAIKADATPLDRLRTWTNLPDLVGVTKHGLGGEKYVLRREGAPDIDLGPARDVLVHSRVRAAVFGQADVLIKTMKPAEHGEFARTLAEIAERRDDVASGEEETRGWLGTYLRQRSRSTLDPTRSDDLFDFLGGASAQGPFTDPDGRLHLRLSDFSAWLAGMVRVRVTVPELSMRLARLGFERTQHAARRRDEVRKARYWTSPADFEVHE